MDGWVNEIIKLAEFATTQPQASYAVYTFGLKHRWTYYYRTLPDIQDLLKPLEDAIANVFLQALLEHNCSPIEREILALPVRKGGIGVANPCNEAQLEYQASRKITAPLVKRIELQMHEIPDDSEIQVLKQDVRKEKSGVLSERLESVVENASPKMKRMIELAPEKGASS